MCGDAWLETVSDVFEPAIIIACEKQRRHKYRLKICTCTYLKMLFFVHSFDEIPTHKWQSRNQQNLSQDSHCPPQCLRRNCNIRRPNKTPCLDKIPRPDSPFLNIYVRTNEIKQASRDDTFALQRNQHTHISSRNETHTNTITGWRPFFLTPGRHCSYICYYRYDGPAAGTSNNAANIKQ